MIGNILQADLEEIIKSKNWDELRDALPNIIVQRADGTFKRDLWCNDVVAQSTIDLAHGDDDALLLPGREPRHVRLHRVGAGVEGLEAVRPVRLPAPPLQRFVSHVHQA